MKLHTKVTCFLLLTVIPNGKELMRQNLFINLSILLVLEIIEIVKTTE